MRLLLGLLLAVIAPITLSARQAEGLFDCIDLGRPELEEVRRLVENGNQTEAQEALLRHFLLREGFHSPNLDLENITLSDEQRRWADEALEHKFFVHSGYQPSFFYGEDIDWQYWPVKDNELRWQLHRMKWWVPMGKAYRLTGDEKYAREWCAQYLDWIEKNPSEGYINTDLQPLDLMSADNVQFAWRALEVSDRMEAQIDQFILFLGSESFGADFLSHFLMNYSCHCRHLMQNFSLKGNHRLFQAYRLLCGAIFFPELRESNEWSERAVEILTEEIKKQVYSDGGQYELDPHYHLEAINIFYNALKVCRLNNRGELFPEEYGSLIERMIEFHTDYMRPDYSIPLFSDAREPAEGHIVECYREWSHHFVDNESIRYFATQGNEGQVPQRLSAAHSESGFYTLRNGWDKESTILTLKAGPEAFWHCQPDNGTFELWHKGRNFFPDTGCYVYSGDSEINRMREWFRQTHQHNTLTLNGKNLEHTSSRLIEFHSSQEGDLLVVENQSYEGLLHRRSLHFPHRKFFVIVDEALGTRGGDVELSYHLLECEPKVDTDAHSVTTRFDDGNNLHLQVWGAKRMVMRCDTGRVSRHYRQYSERPTYRFSVSKEASNAVRFVTVIAPFEGDKAPKCSVKLKGEELRIKAGKERYEIEINR